MLTLNHLGNIPHATTVNVLVRQHLLVGSINCCFRSHLWLCCKPQNLTLVLYSDKTNRAPQTFDCCVCLYLQSASLHHHLLSVRLNSCQCEELSLEHHGWLLGVQLYCIKLLFAPFHIYWKKQMDGNVTLHTHKLASQGTQHNFVQLLPCMTQHLVSNNKRHHGLSWLLC